MFAACLWRIDIHPYDLDYSLCENRVTRLCTVMTGTAFATGDLRQTVN